MCNKCAKERNSKSSENHDQKHGGVRRKFCMKWALQILVYSWSIEDEQEVKGPDDEGAIEIKFEQENKI